MTFTMISRTNLRKVSSALYKYLMFLSATNVVSVKALVTCGYGSGGHPENQQFNPRLLKMIPVDWARSCPDPDDPIPSLLYILYCHTLWVFRFCCNTINYALKVQTVLGVLICRDPGCQAGCGWVSAHFLVFDWIFSGPYLAARFVCEVSLWAENQLQVATLGPSLGECQPIKSILVGLAWIQWWCVPTFGLCWPWPSRKLMIWCFLLHLWNPNNETLAVIIICCYVSVHICFFTSTCMATSPHLVLWSMLDLNQLPTGSQPGPNRLSYCHPCYRAVGWVVCLLHKGAHVGKSPSANGFTQFHWSRGGSDMVSNTECKLCLARAPRSVQMNVQMCRS